MAKGMWTAVGLSRDLEPGTAMGVIVEGREWALWRGRSGRAHLWEDRCPQAGIKVSFGLKPPETLRDRGLPVVESGGLIWACFGETAPQPPEFSAALPAHSEAFDAPLNVMLDAIGPSTAVPHAHARLVERDGDRWLVAGHSVERAKCVLHIAAFGGADSARCAARWAARLAQDVLEPA